MDGLLFHPILFKYVVVTLIPKMNEKMIAACNKIDHGLNSVPIKYWIIRVIILDPNSNCFKKSMMRESSAIIVNDIFTGSLSSSPNVSSCRKKTMIADIHSTIYIMIEKMFMGAVMFCKKLLGKIWNILTNGFKIVLVDRPPKNRVVTRNAKNVDHPA